MTPPRAITHRPDQLRLRTWADLDGRPHLAAWLDVSFADGADWHHPDLVLVDVDCLDLLEVLYGPRTGFTLALAAGPEEYAQAQAAGRDGRVNGAADVTAWPSLRALTILLERHATGTDTRMRADLTRRTPDTTPARPVLSLVPGVAPCHADTTPVQAVQGGAR